MKRLIVIRHAKAVPYGYDDDFTRDLTSRGVSDAEKVSLQLKEIKVLPELVIASPAVRTMHTAGIFCRNLGYQTEAIRTEMSFYEGLTTMKFIEMVQEVSDKVKTIFIVGHNPTVHYLVSNLAGNFHTDMPTCSTVVVEFQIEEWRKLQARSGFVTNHFVPKEL